VPLEILVQDLAVGVEDPGRQQDRQVAIEQLAAGRPIAGCSAQAACSEPAPWQASQPTMISDQVVW